MHGALRRGGNVAFPLHDVGLLGGGADGKLVDNFSHESDVTSLQDPFTSRLYKTPFYFYYCVPCKIPRGILFQIHLEYSPSSRLLVSPLAVYATAFRPMFPRRLIE